MARKIIIQDEDLYSSDFSLNYIFWLNTPTDQIAALANPDAASAVKDATTLEIDAIKSGAIIELSGTVTAPKESTIEFVKSKLETMYGEKQAEVEAKNAFRFYGMYFDGTNWVEGE
jgi:hypothetical protein